MELDMGVFQDDVRMIVRFVRTAVLYRRVEGEGRSTGEGNEL